MCRLFYYFIFASLTNVAYGRPPRHNVQIINAPDGIAPYQVSLRENGEHFCSGAIIRKDWILTSGKCVKTRKKENITAVVGTNLLSSGGDTYAVESIVIHEKFNSYYSLNDIALIKVRDIQYSDKVQPINLPSHETQPGTICIQTEWVFKNYVQDSAFDELKIKNVTTLPLEVCRKKLFMRINSPSFNKKHIICTLAINPSRRDRTLGGRGSPVVKDSELVAITGRPSFNVNPQIDVNVYSYLDWILSHITDDEEYSTTELTTISDID